MYNILLTNQSTVLVYPRPIKVNGTFVFYFIFYSCLMSICNRMVMIDLLPVVMCDIFSLPREFLHNKILFPPPPSRPLISSAADLRGRIRQQTFRTPTGTPLRKQSDKNKRAEAKTLVVALSIDKLQ